MVFSIAVLLESDMCSLQPPYMQFNVKRAQMRLSRDPAGKASRVDITDCFCDSAAR